MESVKTRPDNSFFELERRDELGMAQFLLNKFGKLTKENLIFYNSAAIMVVSYSKKEDIKRIIFARRGEDGIVNPVCLDFGTKSEKELPSAFILEKDGTKRKLEEKEHYAFTTEKLSDGEVGIIVKTSENTGFVYSFIKQVYEDAEEGEIEVPLLLAATFDSFERLNSKTIENFKEEVDKGFKKGGEAGSLLRLAQAIHTYLSSRSPKVYAGIFSFGYKGHTDCIEQGLCINYEFPLLFVVPLTATTKRNDQTTRKIFPYNAEWENVIFRLSDLPKEARLRTQSKTYIQAYG